MMRIAFFCSWTRQRSVWPQFAGTKSARTQRSRDQPRRSCNQRTGITLLELMLALAILGGTMAVLSQIAGTGTDAAREATALSVARLHAQRKMSELLLDQFVTPVSVPPSPVEAFDSQSLTQFTYSVEVMPGQLDGLLSVRVRVEAADNNGGDPIAVYVLDRWMIDPALGLADLEAEERAMWDESSSTTGGDAI